MTFLFGFKYLKFLIITNRSNYWNSDHLSYMQIEVDEHGRKKSSFFDEIKIQEEKVVGLHRTNHNYLNVRLCRLNKCRFMQLIQSVW